MRRRSCFAWSTLAAWRPRCVKRCGLSCWVIISLECPWTRETRYVILRHLCCYSQHLQLKISLSTPHLQVDEQVRAHYQQTMSEWLSCEEIVRQREKEQHVAALAKCSSGASMDSSSQKMILNDSISNEVKPHGFCLQFQALASYASAISRNQANVLLRMTLISFCASCVLQRDGSSGSCHSPSGTIHIAAVSDDVELCFSGLCAIIFIFLLWFEGKH